MESVSRVVLRKARASPRKPRARGDATMWISPAGLTGIMKPYVPTGCYAARAHGRVYGVVRGVAWRGAAWKRAKVYGGARWGVVLPVRAGVPGTSQSRT